MTETVRVHAVGTALAFGCLLTIGAVIGVVAWLFPTESAFHVWLLAASQLALGLSVAMPLLTILASWAAAQPRFLDCTHCRQATPEPELQHMGGAQWLCSRCVAPASIREVA